MAPLKTNNMSRRFMAAIWAGTTSTLVMGASIFTGFDAPWIGVTLPILIGIVALWIGAESYTKGVKITNNKEGQ